MALRLLNIGIFIRNISVQSHILELLCQILIKLGINVYMVEGRMHIKYDQNQPLSCRVMAIEIDVNK